MNFLYFDCFSGISGDMIIGALLDCGASFEDLRSSLSSLPISVNVFSREKVIQGIRCTSFEVEAENAPVRHLADITDIINASDISVDVKNKSLHVFNKLAAAEASIHGMDPAQIHFHEIGAVDTIVDIAGTFICLELLEVDKAYTSPLPWFGGYIDISHGRYPLPAPATALLLSGFPCVFSGADMELVTPTGAALITSIAAPFIDPLPFIPAQIGYGAGDYIRKDNIPNLLRVIRASFQSPAVKAEAVAILETEVDDLNPEVFSHLHHLFTSHPAVFDYFTTPVQMKKNRPGTLITLVVRPDSEKILSQLLMQETGSLGVRYRLQNRYTAPRYEDQVETPWGPVRVKVAHLTPENVRIKPEFDDCQALAVKHGLPLREVYAVVTSLADRKSK